jgi:hypothetical protein
VLMSRRRVASITELISVSWLKLQGGCGVIVSQVFQGRSALKKLEPVRRVSRVSKVKTP